MKKCLALILCVALTLGVAPLVRAADPGAIPDLAAQFKDGVGPQVDGLAVDYVYYEPTVPSGGKLPLVIYFHGAGQGAQPRAQIAENNFPLWASDELQARFSGGGAYLLVPRSHEENGEFWSDEYIPAVKAMIDDFIARHADTVDISRIYVGGFSMGGKMTLKMISSYPAMFAAAFPACPAYQPSAEQVAAFADVPVWLIVSRFDVIAGYYTFSEEIWQNVCAATRVPADCRLSLFGIVCFPDGKKTQSNHHVWFAVANDLFTYDEGAYPNMKTVNAAGEELTLESPDGLIGWLCGHTSAYRGEALSSTGLDRQNPDEGYSRASNIFRTLFPLLGDALSSLFTEIIPFLFGQMKRS